MKNNESKSLTVLTEEGDPRPEGYLEELALQKRYQRMTIEQGAIHQLVGRLQGRKQTAELLTALTNSLAIHELGLLKKSKAYKGFEHEDELGNQITITRWDDFINEVCGLDVKEIDKQILNSIALGRDLYDALDNSGIGKTLITSYRRLPDDDRDPIDAQILEHKNEPDVIIEIVRAGLNDAREENKKLQAKLNDASQDLEIKDRLIEDKNTKIDEYETREQRRKNMPIDEVLAEARQQLSACGDDALIAIERLCAASNKYFDAGGHKENITKDIEGQIHRAIEHMDSVIRELNLHPGQFEFSWHQFNRVMAAAEKDSAQKVVPVVPSNSHTPPNVTHFRGSTKTPETEQ